MAIAVCSCGVTSYSIMGNVTLLSNDGNTIEKWDNATLSVGDTFYGNYNTPYKNGGMELTTEQGERIYVNGGIIIVRNIETNARTVSTNQTQEVYNNDDNSYYGG